MKDSVALWSIAAGAAVGGPIAGCLWWLETPLVLVLGAGIVWTAALASTLYVVQSDPAGQSESWGGAVVGGSLLFGVLLELSELPVSNGSQAALTVLVIAFTLLGYTAGMATSHDGNAASETDGATTETSN